ncbi:MAG TPA: hypothetical protein DD727_05635 [Clostridiales bacterium]|nr:hypothetical protein [Clostridiales bacterium]
MLVSFIRTFILFLLVVASMRLMGKRQIGQLQPFELAAAIMISELAALPMQNTGVPLLLGVIPILTLLSLQLLFSFLSLKSIAAHNLICGKPRVMVEKGRVLQNNLMKEMVTINDLLEQLRMSNYTDLADIEEATLETNGQLSIKLKPDKRPATPSDLMQAPEAEAPPIPLVLDGRLILENLSKYRIDDVRLQGMLKQTGTSRVKDIFLAYLDPKGKFHYQLSEDSKQGAGSS